MKREATGPALSAIFVDYDNIYLALKRKSEEAAKRFSKDAALWLREIETGRLITGTSGFGAGGPRRIVMNRCYGNPMPRRNSSDNSTDMNSFPFVRHHFLRAGSEVIDCPPLTAQLKNSADIRIVMDVRDMIAHDTYFDEFIILSGDADFTPLLHRLRAHARRTIIYANDHTASPYTAISDGEVREQDLLRLLIEGSLGDTAITGEGAPAQLPQPADHAALRRELIAEIASLVRAAGQPVPLEALADRLVRQLGHEKTAGSGWGGAGGFRDLLIGHLPEEFKMSEQAPFVVYEMSRMLPATTAFEAPRASPQPQIARAPQLPLAAQPPLATLSPTTQSFVEQPAQRQPLQVQQAEPAAALPQERFAPQAHAPARAPAALQPAPAQPRPGPYVAPELAAQPQQPQPQHTQPQHTQAQHTQAQPPSQPIAQQAPPQPSHRAQVSNQALAIQQAVARIYEACQAPPLSPPEYRALFEVMAQEISTRGLTGAPTLDNISARAKDFGVDVRRDDVRFVLEVVSETDPWFEQGASANLFSSRFRNFVVARCRSHGMALTAEELDLIEHWFAGASSLPQANQPVQQSAPPAGPQLQHRAPAGPAPAQALTQSPSQSPAPVAGAQPDRWWSMETAQGVDSSSQPQMSGDDFPRIIRTRMRG